MQQPVHREATTAKASRSQWWQDKVLIEGGETAHIDRHFRGRDGKSVCISRRGVQAGNTVAAPGSEKA